MEKITYGILSEGDSDLSSLSILCGRIAKIKGIELELNIPLSKPANGPISDKVIRVRTEMFRKGGVQFAAYFADADKDGFHKKVKFIKDVIRDIDTSWLDRAVVGVPDRNLEAWLLEDQDMVKKILGIPGSLPLPHSEIKDPKEKLIRLVAEYGDEAMTPTSFRLELANKIDLNILKRKSNSFRAFYDDIMMRIVNL